MIREITIRAVLNGYIVNVGCQIVVFQNRDYMMRELLRYLENPDEVEEEYTTKGLNTDQLGVSRTLVVDHNAGTREAEFPEPPEIRSNDELMRQIVDRVVVVVREELNERGVEV